MGTVTAMTAEAMQAIADAAVVDGDRVGDSLILTRGDGSLIDLGEFVTKDDFDDQGPSGRELAVAESTTYQGTISTVTDLTGLSITFTVLSRPVLVELYLPVVSVTAATGSFVFIISDNAGVVKRQSYKTFVASEWAPIVVRERINTPGTYTRKARILRTAGTATAGNNASPAAAEATSLLTATER